MVLRVTVANLTPEDAAQWGQHRGVNGTAFHSLGFGSWGVEPGTTLEFALEPHDLPHLRTLILQLLTDRGEAAAYVTSSGIKRDEDDWTATAGLWYADGRIEVIG